MAPRSKKTLKKVTEENDRSNNRSEEGMSSEMPEAISKRDLEDMLKGLVRSIDEKIVEGNETLQQELMQRDEEYQKKWDEMTEAIEQLKNRDSRGSNGEESKDRKHNSIVDEGEMEEDDQIDMSLYPFSERIRKAKLPPHFVAPAIEKYDGTGDPAQHIKKFMFAMNTQGISSLALCNLFPGTLSKRALGCISTRPPQSITSFKQLTEDFQQYFAASKKVKKETIELMDVKQRKGETVKEYAERFHKKVAEIDDVDEKILIKAFGNGLAQPRLAGKIATKAPKTHGELAEMIHDFLKSEIAENKARELADSFKAAGVPEKKEGLGGNAGRGGSRYKPYYGKSTAGSSSQGSQYQGVRTVVYIDPEKYAAAVREGYLPPPRKPSQGEIPVAFCEFHRNRSHRTVNCATLAKELRVIEENKKKGKQQAGTQRQYGGQQSNAQNVSQGRQEEEAHPRLNPDKSVGMITGL